MWDELGLYRPPTTDLKTLVKRAEEDKKIQLLASLTSDYENFRNQILASSKLPTFKAVCSAIHREETRKKVMNPEPKFVTSESCAFRG